MKVSNAVVFNNLLLMESRGNDGLKYDKFIDEKGRVGHFSKLIDYLFMCDLIEFGEEHEVLYLTDVGYDVLEAGSWYDPELVEDTEVDNRGNYITVQARVQRLRRKRSPEPFLGFSQQ